MDHHHDVSRILQEIDEKISTIFAIVNTGGVHLATFSQGASTSSSRPSASRST